MSGGVGEYAPAPPSVARVQHGRAPLEDAGLSLAEIADRNVKVDLMGASGVRPLRRPIVVHLLERQHGTPVEVERRPAVAEEPARIWLVQHAGQKRW